jgi:hypothetical protein
MDPQRPKVVSQEPVPELNCAERTERSTTVRPLARLRVPLTLTVQPWATLYELPDGRRWWCLRLREDGVVRTRCVPTERLRAYAHRNGLRAMEAALDDALAHADQARRARE